MPAKFFPKRDNTAFILLFEEGFYFCNLRRLHKKSTACSYIYSQTLIFVKLTLPVLALFFSRTN